MRWDTGYFCSGSEFLKFWNSRAVNPNSPRRGLFVAGRGFDPRTTIGARAIACSRFPIDTCYLIRLVNPEGGPGRRRNPEAAEHERELVGLFPGSEFRVEQVAMRDLSGRVVGSTQIRNLFNDRDWIAGYSDVIVDITALPASISFPLLGLLLSMHDELLCQRGLDLNVHCIVCENTEVDERIASEGGDVAEYIDPFHGSGGLASGLDPITIWAPVLGEHKSAELQKIHEMLRPAEVKPFLPFPSRNPRRGDDLVSEYHSLLFDMWEVDPRGFVYADEQDPFDIYRQLAALSSDYSNSLDPLRAANLGTANTVVSAHSSKLLSLGVLLAAFEHELAIAHVEPTGYANSGSGADWEANELFEIWLTGEPYVSD